MVDTDKLSSYLRDRSIFFRLFWSFVTTSILIILVAMLFYYNNANQSTEQQVREEVEDSLQQSIALFEKGYIAPIESALSIIEMSPSLNNFLKTPREQAELLRVDIEKQFIKLADTYPELYHSIRLVDGSGNETIVVDEEQRIRRHVSLLDNSQQAPSQQLLTSLFKQLKAGEPRQIYFSPIYLSPQGHPHFYAGIALLEPGMGGFGGAVLFECDLGEFVQEIGRLTYRGHAPVSLLAAGNELTPSHAIEGDEVIEHDFHPGYSSSGPPFLSMRVRVPAGILKEQRNAIFNSILPIALMAVVATFVVAWLLSRQIISPITELVCASKRLSEGDFTPVDGAENGSEIGQLSRAFNVMGERLNESLQSRARELETRINAELDLQATHDDLQLILNSTGEGIFGIDKEGDCTFCNRAALELLGYEQDSELIGNNMHTLLHSRKANGEVYPQSESPIISTLLTGTGVHRDDECFWRADQSSFPVKYNAQPIMRDDEVVGAVVTFSDITEAHNNEETLRRTQKMDALGKLTGGIAHDFNNMLGVILGYGELLEETLDDNPKQAKYLHEINQAAGRARKLTSRLLTFSRKGSSDVELANISQVVLDEQHMLEKTITPQITLSLDLEHELWDVCLDKAALEDAILNMCINAMHAMPNGGHLSIRSRNVHFEEMDIQLLGLSAGDYVELSITDTGIGMDKDTRQKLFDPFFTTKGDLGTGLGMSQVYGFVKQAGGGINLYSEPGEGTHIYLFFPRFQSESMPVEAAVTTRASLLPDGDETILVVDDEPALCELATDILTSHGYRVLSVGGGEQALKVLEKESVDLLLSDVIMPDMNGYALARKVEQLYPQIKIQMVSGFSDRQNIDGMNKGLHEQRLQKPYNSEILLQRVRMVLDELIDHSGYLLDGQAPVVREYS